MMIFFKYKIAFYAKKGVRNEWRLFKTKNFKKI